MFLTGALAFLCLSWAGSRPPPSRPRAVALAAADRTVDALSDLKVYELKAVCRAKGLKVSGRKAELVERIRAAPPGLDEAVARRAPVAAAPAATQLVAVEVLDSEEAELADEQAGREARREARRSDKRTKLSQYFQEEFESVTNSLAAYAGAPFAAALGRATSPAAALGGAAAGSDVAYYMSSLEGCGRRLAWCSRWADGAGMLVDLEDQAEWAFDSSALRVSERVPEAAVRLHAGEFVEYELAAAQLAEEGEFLGDSWVSGIMGWPLMCDQA